MTHPSALLRPLELSPDNFVRVLSTLSAFVAGNPLSKGRPRASVTESGHVHMRTPKETVRYESLVALELLAARIRARTWPEAGWYSDAVTYAVQIEFVVPSFAGDIDNKLKAILDAANKIIWPDDTRVIVVNMSKRRAGDGEQLGAAIRVLAVTASGRSSEELARVPAGEIEKRKRAEITKALKRAGKHGPARPPSVSRPGNVRPGQVASLPRV